MGGVKDFIKSLPKSLLTFIDKKENYTHIAVRPQSGLGDMLRQKSVLFEILKMPGKVVFDIYNTKSYQIYKDLPNLRFIMHSDALGITKKNYDIILTMYYAQKPVIINNENSPVAQQMIKNINQYKNNKSGISFMHWLDYEKSIYGVGGLGDYTLYLKQKKCNLNKFGITAQTKLITFQCGCGNGLKSNTKSWQEESWAKMLQLLKKYTKDKFKIVQIGTKSNPFSASDINLLNKTSFDELVCVISRSSLHIDTDCGCVHIAKATNTKSLVLWGQQICINRLC
jgi:hypothetical protein